jgi:hypothetical protein
MLSNFTQYSPQGLMPQFPGLQTAGLPQINQGFFGQGQPSPYNGASPYNGHSQFGHESGQAGLSQQFPFVSQPSPFGGQFNPLQNAFAGHPGVNVQLQQIVPLLAQLAQQIAVQSALAQQIGFAVHQLAHQLAAQGLGQGPGAGQAFAAPQAFIGGGFNPQQAQAWGANRPQTVQ